MKILKIVLFSFLFLLWPAHSHSSTLGEISISLLEGDVQIKAEDDAEWFPASINMPLIEGDMVWVQGDGKLEISSNDATYVRLNERSSIQILRMQEDSIQFYVPTGQSYVNFGGPKSRMLQLDTPAASMHVYERSKFGIDVTDNGYTEISVFEDLVHVESPEGENIVRAGERLSVEKEGYAEISSLGPVDEWERWNIERDQRVARKGESYRYLPSELRGYAYDLDDRGRWVYVPRYGYVWTPDVVVGWAPYRAGRWVWVGDDYVWISYEPWGWVPYHYGRWIFNVTIGWCWVPPAAGYVYWAPGWVGWVYTPTYVAWVPLLLAKSITDMDITARSASILHTST